jgi:asparagine N-glycosylation enzyme membrane subunit Stt3
MKIKPLDRDTWANLLLFLALLLGIFVRFNPTSLAGFAVNQGGMFAVMVDDLKSNHYLLPVYTSYNHLNIPFAYPPLGFYIGAIVSQVFSIDSVQVIRWLPAFFASLSIIAFYVLARRLVKNTYFASVAVLFFALMPRAFSWYVTGSGLTRAPSQFFLLLTLAMVVRLYEEKRRTHIWTAGIFAGLTILSHPEAAIHMITSVIFLGIMIAPSRKSFLHTVGVGLIAFILTSPWWMTVIHYHGIAPLINAAQTGQKTSAIFNLLFFDFTEESYMTVLAVLGLIGIARCIVHREYLLPLWLVIPFLVEGRSAVLPAAIPLSMLAALGFIDVVGGVLSKFESGANERDQVHGIEFGILIYLVSYLTFSTYQFGTELILTSLPIADREAMGWVKENTPAGSRFLVLTGTNSISCDAVLEWFPALSERQSLFTVQGTEWTKGADFVPYVLSTYGVQECLREGDISCLDSAVHRNEYDFLYITKVSRQNCRPVKLPKAFYYFLNSVRHNPGFHLAYESDDVIIFGK